MAYKLEVLVISWYTCFTLTSIRRYALWNGARFLNGERRDDDEEKVCVSAGGNGAPGNVSVPGNGGCGGIKSRSLRGDWGDSV